MFPLVMSQNAGASYVPYDPVCLICILARPSTMIQQEVDKFEKAFKDPEFMKMFADYAKEISDPKV